jgi:quercetin dioxygenase-like cupin family protein
MDNVVTIADLDSKMLTLEAGHHGGRIWSIFNKETIRTETLTVSVQEYRPGEYTEGHGPHAETEQAYYILTGTMAVHVSGKEYIAKPGSFVFIPRGAEHGHRNAGTDNLRFITINGAVRKGNTRK